MIIEFGTLSRLTGNPLYEETAMRALRALWYHRSKIGLVGNHIDVVTGIFAFKNISTQYRVRLDSAKRSSVEIKNISSPLYLRQVDSDGRWHRRWRGFLLRIPGQGVNPSPEAGVDGNVQTESGGHWAVHEARRLALLGVHEPGLSVHACVPVPGGLLARSIKPHWWDRDALLCYFSLRNNIWANLSDFQLAFYHFTI